MVDMNYLFDTKGVHLVPYPAQFAVPLFPEAVKKECLRDLLVSAGGRLAPSWRPTAADPLRPADRVDAGEFRRLDSQAFRADE